jgi:hypothetical protein
VLLNLTLFGSDKVIGSTTINQSVNCLGYFQPTIRIPKEMAKCMSSTHEKKLRKKKGIQKGITCRHGKSGNPGDPGLQKKHFHNQIHVPTS